MFVTLSPEQKRIAESVASQGYAVTSVDSLLPSADCYQALRDVAFTFAGSQRVADCHAGFLRGEKRLQLKQFLVKYQDDQRFTERHPLFRFGLLPEIHQTACACLGRMLSYYSADLWCVLPDSEGKPREWSQDWHRDPEADRLIKVFLFLEDVTDAGGPLEYVPQSQCDGKARYAHVGPPKRYPLKEQMAEVPPKDRMRFLAPAGTLVFLDTSGLHRGGYTRDRRRLNCVWTFLPDSRAAKFTLESVPADLSEIQRQALCLN